MKDENKQLTLPYVSYPTFKTFIRYLHDTVVSEQIDNTMMPPSFSGSARAAVTAALKSLGLIDAQNNTSQQLRDLAAAYEGKEWPAMVKQCILSAYTNIPENFDLKSATRKQVEGMFGDITPQMLDKCIRFFLTANKEARIEYSPHLKIRRRQQRRRADTSAQKRTKPHEERLKHDKTPSGMFDLPIPIASGSFIRVPTNITAIQVPLVEAAVKYLEAMARQNEETKE
jgi:hypothetical protein